MWNRILSIFANPKKENLVLKDKLVLVVDDGELERRTAQRILQKEGCKVLCASNGQEGLDFALRQKPDLILLDCMMPEMTGPEVCKRLKNDEKTKSVPIIFLTASDTPSNIINCYDLGGEQFLAKPVTAKTLIKQIETILSEHD